jgi:hypothetical protein
MRCAETLSLGYFQALDVLIDDHGIHSIKQASPFPDLETGQLTAAIGAC